MSVVRSRRSQLQEESDPFLEGEREYSLVVRSAFFGLEIYSRKKEYEIRVCHHRIAREELSYVVVAA